MRELATIVIPVFDTAWPPVEYALLRHARKVLTGFPLVIVCPHHLDTGRLTEDFGELTVYRFDPSFFTDHKGYTRLLLDPEFYDSFGWSEFILLLEKGTYIVKNELRYWCKQGHDYLSDAEGSLSLRRVDRFLSRTKSGKSDIFKFLSGDFPYGNDRAFWEKKTKGWWPSLISPTPVVSAYFSRPVTPALRTTAPEKLPFALTGFEKNYDAHPDLLPAS